MTMQDTRPEAPPTPSASDEHAAAPPADARRPSQNWLGDWLTTGDHRRIGRLYVALALAFAVAVLVIGALLAFERVDDGSFDILHADAVAGTPGEAHDLAGGHDGRPHASTRADQPGS